MRSTVPIRVAALLVAWAFGAGIAFRSPAAALVPGPSTDLVAAQVDFASPELPGPPQDDGPHDRRNGRAAGGADGAASVSDPVLALLPDGDAPGEGQAALLPGGTGTGTGTGAAAGQAGISGVVLAAYRNAERRAPEVEPGCEVRWSIVAGIGRVESKHGMHNGAGTTIAPSGEIDPAIIGGQLNGDGDRAAIRDTDAGRWDRDTEWDRAVGPMQFIPSSWQIYGVDGNGDGIADPNNVFDAALAAARHLCRSQPGDYDDPATLGRALFAYNRSSSYVALVQSWISVYDRLGPDGAAAATVASYTPSTSQGGRPQGPGQIAMGPAAPAPSPVPPVMPPATGEGGAAAPPATSPPAPTTPSDASPPVTVPPADPPTAGPPQTQTPGVPAQTPGPVPSSPDPTPSPSPSPSPEPTPSPDPSPAPPPAPATPQDPLVDPSVQVPDGLPAGCAPDALAGLVRRITGAANDGDQATVARELAAVGGADAIVAEIMAAAARSALVPEAVTITYPSGADVAALDIALTTGPWAAATVDCGSATLSAWSF